MIKNSDLFYRKAQDFQDTRKSLTDNYTQSLKKMEKYKGSPAYDEETKKLKKQYEDSLATLKQEYTQAFTTILNGMENTIGRRPAKAPTVEQLNLLNLLKMKAKPTESDFEMTANSCADCPMALSIITELAHANGVHRNYTRLNPIMDNGAAQQLVYSLRDSISDFLEYDSSRASRVAQRYYSINQGIEIELTPRRTFSDKEGFFSVVGGLSEEVMSQFCKVVDGDD